MDNADIVIGGKFGNAADFDPNPDSTATVTPCDAASFVARYTSSGAYRWAFPLGGCIIDDFIPGWNEVNGVAYTPDDGVLATGTFRGLSDFDPGPEEAILFKASGAAIFLASYDAEGAYRWAFQVGDDQGEPFDVGVAFAVAADASGGGVAVGWHWMPADFDPDPASEVILTPPAAPSGFIASYDAAGAYRWAFNLGPSPSEAWDVAIDELGNVYVTGDFYGTVDFDPDPDSEFTLTTANPPFASGFVASYDVIGQFRWADRLPGGHGRALTLDALGNIVYAGTRPSFLGSYQSDGMLRWNLPLDATSSEGSATALGVALLPGHRFAVVGELFGTVDFDPSPDMLRLTSAGQNDIFIAAYADGGGFPVASEPEGALPTHFGLEPAYPNPFNPRATIPFALPEAARVTLTVYDVLGRHITTLADGLFEAGRHNVVLDGSRLASGFYLVRAVMAPEGGADLRAFTRRLTLLR